MLQDLFREARQDSRDGLRASALLATYRRGETMQPTEEGRPPVIVVIDGVVGRVTRRADGREFVHGLLEPGAIAGLTSIHGHRVETEFVARTDATVASWGPSALRQIAITDPGAALDLLRHGLDHALEQEALLAQRLSEPATVRLARLMVEKPHLVFDAERPVIRRSELGQYVGTSREMAERILRGFERRGLVRRVGPSGIVPLDPEGLRRVIQPD